MQGEHHICILSFLETQSAAFVEKLYKNPIFSTFLLKVLPDHTLSLIFDLLYKARHITKLQTRDDVILSVKLLRSLNLLYKEGQNIYLNKNFRKALLEGFVIIDMQNFFFRTKESYKERSSKKLEEILQSIVDPGNHKIKVRDILTHGGLTDSEYNITHKGFEFLLKTHKDQMWLLLIYGIELIAATEAEKETYLLALAEISHKKAGTCYKTSLSKKILHFFSQVGLVDIVQDNLVLLRYDSRTLFESDIAEINKFLIVETNHKVYAYTTSTYELSILSLFCRIEFKLAFLVVGSISEENINKAFNKGITAQQIVHYLSAYSKYLPKAIKDLVFTWESQKKRMSIADSYLYTNFLNFSDFRKVFLFCKENNFLIDHDKQKRMVVVKVEAHPFLKDFVKKHI